MSVTSGKGLTVGDGLDSLAVAIFLLGMIYMIGCGIGWVITTAHFGYTTSTEARCNSINGYYGDTKCFINGEEV